MKKESWIRQWGLNIKLALLAALLVDFLLNILIYFFAHIWWLFALKYVILIPALYFWHSRLIGPAINNKMWQKIQKQVNYISFMERINHIMISNLHFQENFVEFARVLKKQVDFDRCIVFGVDEKAGYFKVDGFYDGIQELDDEEKSHVLSGSLLEEIVLSGKAKVYNFGTTIKYHDRMMLGARTRSAILIPMTYHNEVIGIFALSSLQDRQYSYANLNFLESVVERLTAALQNYILYQETKNLSLKDYLTDTANRRALDIQLKYEYRRSKRYQEPFSVLIIDLDHFKNFNDTHGHIAGDQVLKEIASIMKREIREIDLLARFGGEEFVILLPGTDREHAGQVAERIRRSVYDHVFLAGKLNARLTVCIGVATYSAELAQTGEVESIQELLRGADLKLYCAKNHGRNKVELIG